MKSILHLHGSQVFSGRRAFSVQVGKLSETLYYSIIRHNCIFNRFSGRICEVPKEGCFYTIETKPGSFLPGHEKNFSAAAY